MEILWKQSIITETATATAIQRLMLSLFLRVFFLAVSAAEAMISPADQAMLPLPASADNDEDDGEEWNDTAEQDPVSSDILRFRRIYYD